MSIRAFINFAEAENTAVGINISQGPSQELVISYCVLKNVKGVLSLVKKNKIGSFEQLMSELQHILEQGVRIHLNFEGKGVLTRNAEHQRDSSFEQALSYFPGLKKEDFIVQTYRGSSQDFYALFRKEAVESNVFFQRYGNSVYHLSLGVFILHAVLPFLQQDHIALPGLRIERANGAIHQIINDGAGSAEGDIRVGDENIDAESLLAYASAVNIFSQSSELKTMELEGVIHSRKLFEVKKSIFSMARTALFLLVGILVINAVAFFHFKDKVQSIEADVAERENRLSQTGIEQEKKSKLEKLYQVLGWRSNGLPIYYADQLAASVTPEIELSKLEIGYADLNSLKKNKKIVFYSDMIKVEGYAQEASSINAWIGAVEKLDWVDHIEEQKYQYDAKSKKGFFEFIVRSK